MYIIKGLELTAVDSFEGREDFLTRESRAVGTDLLSMVTSDRT